ncbi:UDP-glucose 6-dehydrogenase TuaD [Bacillus luti]|uniref:UDP-glucose 6-dehydrogenase TuaD n=1 Tax=Bacillus luti TaxID=2026191 RepID=UPI003775657A
MRKICVVGTGYVGLVSGTCFANIGNEVVCCDKDISKIIQLNNKEIPIYEPGLAEMVENNVKEGRLSFTTDIEKSIQDAEIIYIAVGTPMSESGEANLEYVQAVAKTVGENLNSYKVIVNKSTVPVGTGKMVREIILENLKDKNLEFDVVSNPEFLREGSAVKDCMNMERAIIGADNQEAANIIVNLHKPFNTKTLVTDIETAEMIKYAANAFLATKISFINAVANICEKVGADVIKVAEGMGMDSRIGHKYLNAGIGYGGSCFPKDTHALVHIAQSIGYDFKLLESVIETNNSQKQVLVEKVKELFGDVSGKTFAVLGLAFKPDTDDMRYAPALTVIPQLIDLGASIKAFDPIATHVAQIQLGDTIQYCDGVYEALENSDACIILTEWDQFKNMDLNKLYKSLKNPIVIDGRNIFDLNEMKEKGFNYYSIGRKGIVQEKKLIEA